MSARHMRVAVEAPDGIGEVREGDDLAALVLDHLELSDGDIVAITSKVVSKAEGRRRLGDRADALAAETVRVVARRGLTTIARTRLGLTLAAAGIDASNVAAGTHLLLPLDPDGTARQIREAVQERAGVNVAVLVTDTAGRPWRSGQTDIAIGASGLVVAEDYTGVLDEYGNPLLVTEPAVADELAGAAELASGKLGGRPVVLIRGRSDLVLPVGEHGSGAAALVRPDGEDMFGFGAREAVVAALVGRDGAVFGAPAAETDLALAIEEVLRGTADVVRRDGTVEVHISAPFEDELAALSVLAFAFGWRVESDPVDGLSSLRLRFLRPSP